MALYFPCGKTSGPKATRDYSPAPSALHGSQRMKNIIEKLESSPAFLEMNREKNHQRIAQVLQQAKPLTYYLDLLESPVYQDAKQQIIALSENKISISLAHTAPLTASLISRFFCLRWFKKVSKNTAKYVLKSPWIREGLYRSYYHLLLWYKKHAFMPKVSWFTSILNFIIKIILNKKRTN